MTDPFQEREVQVAKPNLRESFTTAEDYASNKGRANEINLHRTMLPTSPEWKPTASRISDITWAVLGAAVVCILGTDLPIAYVAIAGLAMWILIVGGIVAFNLVRAALQR